MRTLILSIACLSFALLAPLAHAEKLEIPQQIEKLDREIQALSLMRTHIASVPERDREALLFRSDQRAFQVLRDWAGGLTFDRDECERERGVVLEEWRLGQGLGERIQKATLKVCTGQLTVFVFDLALNRFFKSSQVRQTKTF